MTESTDGEGRGERRSLWQVAKIFAWLGATAFGGPAAHLALMESEIVTRRKWISREEFLDLMGVTHLIPGPNSTEMAIHIGRVAAGWRGLLVAGFCFITPAATIVALLAWAYVRFGTLPIGVGVLYGVKPVVLAVVLQAVYKLAKTAIKEPVALVLAVAITVLGLLRQHELVLLFGGALAHAIMRSIATTRNVRANSDGSGSGSKPRGASVVATGLATTIPAALVPKSLLVLALTFLKIGATLYGSGYVLVTFLRNDFVTRLGWINDAQLLDAVSVGQVTPGPVFTTATFVGFVTSGPLGALVATVAIFLPSFVFVALTGPLVVQIRKWRWASIALDGVNVAAIGLMLSVTIDLARATFVSRSSVDIVSVVLFVISASVLLRTKLNATWLIAGAAVVGVVATRAGLALRW